jgi:hypothetical protein
MTAGYIRGHIAAIAGDALLELVMGKVGDEWREHDPAGIPPP